MTARGPIMPGATIGVLGGGQLGRMLALDGRAMGYRFVTLDPTPDAPCGQAADEQIVADYDDIEAARRLAERSDVITYEFENVDSRTAALLQQESYVPQGSELLHTTQHRLREKSAIEAAGVPVAPYRAITSRETLHEAVAAFGSCVLKTATGGYDGKGQAVIRRPEEADDAYDRLGAGSVELVLEQFVVFEKEISVIAARSTTGEVRTFPPAENIHVNNILHLSIAPARIDEQVAREAERIAAALVESLGATGLLAIEMFLTADGSLYVNELAPRPHNSGHYTMDGCTVSQFEQHLRAICGLPLPKPRLLTETVMVNLLGEHMERLTDWLHRGGERELPEGLAFKLHLYGKQEAKKGRKMGHINLVGDAEAALRWIGESRIWEA